MIIKIVNELSYTLCAESEIQYSSPPPRFQLPVVNCSPEADDLPSDLPSEGQQ